MMTAPPFADRRRFLLLSGAFGLALAVRVRPVQASPERLRDAIAKVTGGAPIRDGRVKLDIPPLVENGNSIQCTLSAASPMTEEDHVRALHLFNEKNPQPNVIGVRFGPGAGEAKITTRIRLAGTQNLVALAELSDGRFWAERVEVVVTLAACIEDP